MSLATRCPYCRTTFRVTHDQLKLRGGLVRCGSCKEIFNGVEHLLPPAPSAESGTPRPGVASLPVASSALSSTPPPAETPRAADLPPAGPVEPTATDSENSVEPTADLSLHEAQLAGPDNGPSDFDDAGTVRSAGEVAGTGEDDRSTSTPEPPQSTRANPTHPESRWPGAAESPEPIFADNRSADAADADTDTDTDRDVDPLTRMTLMDIRPDPVQDNRDPEAIRATTTQPEPEVDEISRAIDDLQSKPWRAGSVRGDTALDEIDALDNDEPEFVRRARRQQAIGKQLRLGMIAGSIVLALLALFQAAIAFRTQIAAQWPATMPLLARLCQPVGCVIATPAQIEFVTIESHELQAMPASDNTFTLNLLLRNRSDVMQAWPHIQLSLNDPAGEPIIRRVLAPAEYLVPGETGRGLAAMSERPVRVTFSVTQLKASGYVLHLFYP